MASTQQQNPAGHRHDLHGTAAIECLRDMVKDSPDCFFCTTEAPGRPTDTRPMNVREIDMAGNFWFLSSSDSLKNHELARDASVELFFHEAGHSRFLHVTGHATVSRDPRRIAALWEPRLKSWFTGGQEDPHLTVIKVTPTSGQYWDHQQGDLMAGARILLGVAMDEPGDDLAGGTSRPH